MLRQSASLDVRSIGAPNGKDSSGVGLLLRGARNRENLKLCRVYREVSRRVNSFSQSLTAVFSPQRQTRKHSGEEDKNGYHARLDDMLLAHAALSNAMIISRNEVAARGCGNRLESPLCDWLHYAEERRTSLFRG